jgi:hypothetical protein
MFNARLLIILPLLAMVINCSGNDRSNITEKKELMAPQQLNVEEIVRIDNQTEIINPRVITIVDDEYLMVSSDRAEGFLQIFQLPDLEYLYSWGKSGRGPDEFEHTPLTEINAFGDTISVYHFGTQSMRYYTVNDTALVPDQEVTLSYEDQTDVLNNISRLEEGVYIMDYGDSPGQSSKEHIALETDNENPVFTFGGYPESDLSGFERYWKFMKSSTTKPDGSRFAAFYYFHNLIRIYDSNGDLKHELIIEDETLNDRNEQAEEFHYRSLQSVSDSWIYSLGYNERREVMSENVESHINSLEIWDWEGNPVYRALFDHPIHGFTVSEEHGLIIGYSLTDMENLYVYEIPDL